MDSQSNKEQIIASDSARLRPKKTLLIAIIALVLVAIVVVAVVLIVNKNGSNGSNPDNPGSSSSSSPAATSDDPGVLNNLSVENTEDVNAARASAMNYQLAAIKRVNEATNKDKDVDAYEKARDEFEKQVENLSGVSQLYYGIRYAEFVFLWEHSADKMNEVLDKAVKIARKYEPLATTDETRVDYLVIVRNIYVGAGKATEAEIYDREIKKLTVGDQNGEG
ncbi:hypothetical protein IJJ46_00265 [Candidatus Saccharibacteria bacterium]|nr:hypothetical protein [Candidatus Saccharibacteria bacterium]